MRVESLAQKTKDAKIIEALKEQVTKLKRLSQLKTDVVKEDTRLRAELKQETEAKAQIQNKLVALQQDSLDKGKAMLRLQARVDRQNL